MKSMTVSEAIDCIAGMRIFITSRERIKKPEGDALFDEAIDTLRRLTPAGGEDGREADFAQMVWEMRNFADVADRCELTEGNASAAIRAWANRLDGDQAIAAERGAGPS